MQTSAPRPQAYSQHFFENLGMGLRTGYSYITQNAKLDVIFTHHKLNCSDSVICKDMLLHNSHIEWTIALATPYFIRPVLLKLLLSLLDIGYHGNDPYLFLPHQVPEVCDCDWQGT